MTSYDFLALIYRRIEDREVNCFGNKRYRVNFSGNVDGSHVSPTRVERVLEENKRLLSLMEEKDRKIHLLEFKIEQLMKDTKTIVEDQSRLQVENTTLLKALSTLDKKQQVTKGGEK